MAHIWLKPFGSAAIARSGCVYDKNDPAHCGNSDALRVAQQIQEARDSKDYSEVDRLRSHFRWARVIMGKDDTIAITGYGSEDDLGSTVPFPDWGGCTEWVSPESVNGRRIIDTCYRGDVVHSHEVMNWHDHPNLAKARGIGLPTSLWEGIGQTTLAHSKDCDWFNQQYASIEAATVNIAVARICQELRAA